MHSRTDEINEPIIVFDRPAEADEKSSLGFCPICNSEGRTKTGEFIICARAHPYMSKEALSAPRQLSLLAEQALKNPDAPYGYCPLCNAKGITRERRPNGYDHCANGHGYSSSKYRRKPIGYFCPISSCGSIRVLTDHREGNGTCGRGHVHEIAAFIARTIET